MSNFSELYSEVTKSCSWETISEELNVKLGKECGEEEVQILLRHLEDLNNADLEDDAGDVGDYYWRLRTSISDALAAAGDIATPYLLKALESPNPQAAQYAARSLGKIRAVEAIEPIANILNSSIENADRLTYLSALGDMKEESSVPILIPYLEKSHEKNGGWLVRCSANALGDIGLESSVKPLAEVLSNDQEWFARLGAAEGLGKLAFEGSLFPLKKALKDSDHRVSKVAQESIDKVTGELRSKKRSIFSRIFGK